MHNYAEQRIYLTDFDELETFIRVTISLYQGYQKTKDQ